MKYIRKTDLDNLEPLLHLINGAYRGIHGAGRWTTENHLVAGDRIDREGLSAMIQGADTEFIVGYLHDKVSACIAIKYHNDVVEFGAFAVDPELQGGGVGSHLLSYAEGIAAEDVKIFQVSVVSENADLVAFYERRGYRKTGQRIDYPIELNVGRPKVDGLDLIVLEKRSAR